MFNNNGNTSGNNKGSNLNLTCKSCGNVGHIIERCSDLIGYNKPFSKPIVKTNCNANFA